MGTGREWRVDGGARVASTGRAWITDRIGLSCLRKRRPSFDPTSSSLRPRRAEPSGLDALVLVGRIRGYFRESTELRRFWGHITIYQGGDELDGAQALDSAGVGRGPRRRTAFVREVYARWFHEVSRWARAFGGLDADLDDLTQEVFLVVRRKLSGFDGKNLNGWLYRIAQRTVRDYRRRAWFRNLLPRKTERISEREQPSSTRDPAELFEQREAERFLVRILDRMSEARRASFILFEIEGYSGEEIAALEGVPVNTVWTRLHHARKEFATLVARAREEGWIP